MSKSKASRRARDAKHVRLYLYMLRTPAWLTMSCTARCLLIELQALYNGSNNGELFMSVRSAAKLLNTGTKQASAALRELAEHGFIRATRRGSMTRRGETRLATCWRLTEHDDDLTGREPTKEFMMWRPGERNPTVVPENTHRRPREHGTVAEHPKMAPDRGPREHAQADFEASTVVSGNTQLVNHPGAPFLVGHLIEDEGTSAQTAQPLPAPSAQNVADTILVEIVRGPSGRKFGAWLREQRAKRQVPVEVIAAAVSIRVSDLEAVEAGRAQLGPKARRSIEATLARFKGRWSKPYVLDAGPSAALH